MQTGMKPSEFEELINNLAVEDKLLNINETMQAACKMLISTLILLFMHSVFLLRVALFLGPAARQPHRSPCQRSCRCPGTPSLTAAKETQSAKETILSKCSK